MIEVIVIGGGIAGCATAFYLAREGAEVMLLEQGEINTQASGANAGSLHAQIPHDPFAEKGEDWARRFQPVVELCRASLGLWRELETDLEADLEIAFCGGLIVGSNDAQLREIEAKARIERAAGLDVELLSRTDLHRMAPYVADGMTGGALCAVEGKANPLLVGPAFAAAARRHGAVVRTHERLCAIERRNGCYRVVTDQAEYDARRVVDAAGIEAGRVAGMVGASLAIRAFPIQVSVTEPVEPLVEHLLYYAGAKLTMKQTRLGTILIGGGWEARLDAAGRPATDPENLARNLGVALKVVPALGPVQLVRSWPAMVNGTDDWLPIIGELPNAPGFFITYVPWIGFTAGPAAALVTASLVLGKVPPLAVNLRSFAP
ncbi:MAG: NAD(P)/FAD-dependent oxidoreductase [Parasphingopyxis sp.]|uniref:NAD(P)/FAD-dependent oxidoreductase n=1 Tax=Parasphingopyxis sp. TaxID=1920299 RepID=UPI003F9FAE5F